jgi:hypothetical protein
MLAALMGCSTVVASEDKSARNEWLFGHWIPIGANCESDAGVVFRSDGSWLAYESAGTWALEGQTLVTSTTHRWKSGDGIEHTSSEPERHSERIQLIGLDAYRSHRADAQTVEMRRCPKLPG